MMFKKSCFKCGRAASVELNMRPLCSEHAFESIQAAKGKVEMPRPLK